ncbi:hypothetical protein [Dactylosporangium sp. NPDC005555]|uniref:hypothetical protein n=1 Tax=Dactylosporangium sp. NPDC005555 TaxID=3154889 RepID=UPI0033ACF6AE
MQPWQYVVLAGFGAFHGLNPGMGWLLALAGGVRERRRSAIAATLGPIALGHAASVFAIATLVTVLMSVTTARLVTTAGGIVLAAAGIWRLWSPGHGRRPGPRKTDLLAWSFVMSSAHGAGLVLLPLLAAVPVAAAHHDHGGVGVGSTSAVTGILATAVHTGAMVAAAGVVALIAYEVLRLRPVRIRARLDTDRVWAFALIGSGIATLAVTFWPS